MNNKRRKAKFVLHSYGVLFVPVGMLIAALVISWLHTNIHEAQVRDSLLEELEPYVYILDKKNPTVWDLRLQHFWTNTMYNPILALPGVDTSELKQSIFALKESQADYLSFFTPKEQEHIRTTLHPFEFLETLPELEDARQTFTTKPTYKNALHYSETLLQTLQLQRDYASELSDTFLLLQRDGFDTAFLPGTTTDAHVAELLAEMYTRLESQIIEVENRKRCLLGWKNTSPCSIAPPSTTIISSANSDFRQQKILRHGEALKRYIHEDRVRHSPTQTQSEDLPLVHISRAACPRTLSGTYAFTWRPSLRSGNVGFWASPVDEFYFHDVRQRSTAFQAALADAGVSYEFQPMNPYFCIDSGFDTGNIRTAYYIQNSLTENPLFRAQNSENVSIKRLARLERDLVAQVDILHISSLETYIAEAQKFLYTANDTSLLSVHDTVRLLEIITTWRAQSAWLSSEIIRLESMSATSAYVLKTMPVPISALFLTRGYFSTLLLANNTTLHEHPVSFLEKHTPINLTKAGLVTYPADLSSFVSLENLSSLMREEDEQALEVYTR